MSTIRVVNIQHSDATEPNIVLEADGTATFVSGITISGGTNLTVSGTAEFASGTVSAPGITFIDDNNTGIYEPAADTVAITTAATERLRVDSIGNVGIGNTAPGAKLQIEGTSDQLKLTYTSIASYIHEVHSNGDYSVSKDSSERMRIDSSGTLTVGPQYDRLNVNPGSGSYDGDPTSVVIDGRTNNGDATAFKIDRFDGSGNASTKFFVNYAGNVGIGTTSPSNLLHLNASSDAAIRLDRGGTKQLNIGTDSVQSFIASFESKPLAFATSTSSAYTERMRIDSSGNVGIGTTSVFDTASGRGNISLNGASSALIALGVGGSQKLALFHSGTDCELNNQANGFLAFKTNNSERMRIDSSGRLLIGTSSSLPADSQLQVEGTGYYEGGASLRRNSNDTGGTALRICKSRGTSNGSFNPVVSGDTLGIVQFNGADGNSDEIGSEIRGEVDGSVGNGNMPGRLVFSTNSGAQNAAPTERMRIDDEGIIYHNSSNHGIGTFLTQSAGTVKYAFRGHYGSSAGSYGGNISFTVWSNGNVENTNNSYGAISDIKLKENIVDANSQWNDLKALQVRNYNFKEGQTHTQIGLVAQEAELISPGLVYESPDRDEEGNDLGTVTKSVNYSVLYMKAVKALQEAMERIETLESKVSTLEAQ